MNNLKGEEFEYKIKYHTDLEMSINEKNVRIEYKKEQIQTELLYLKNKSIYYL